ncbi:MAG: hypothetical protein JNM31_13210 [Flavobacteriales bacterium]|nr:hypothetical protein [Flavobacteriales bacterium]
MRHLTTIALLASALVASAQNENRGRSATLSLGGHYGEPLGEFEQVWESGFPGLGGQLSVPMRRLPFEWGLGFTWSYLGNKDFTVPIDVASVPSKTGELDVNVNLYAVHPFLRFRPIQGRVMPYVDGLAGARAFTIRTRLTADGVDGPLSKKTEDVDIASSWGWAVGLMVAVTGNLYVEGRFEKLRGGEATYVDRETIDVDANGRLTYGTRTSTTDMWLAQLGIALRF